MKTTFSLMELLVPDPYKSLVGLSITASGNFSKVVTCEMSREEAVQDTVIGTTDRLDEIRKQLDDLAEVTNKSFGMINEMRFLQGIQNIESAYNEFINVSPSLEAWEKKMKHLENHVFELGKQYDQFLNPSHLERYLTMMAEKKEGIPKMMAALDFMVATEAKYLQMMVLFHHHNLDAGAVDRQFAIFNKHLESLNGTAKELGVTRRVPEVKCKVAMMGSDKVMNGNMLQRMVMEGDLSTLESVRRFLSPETLNTPTPGSVHQQYHMGIPGESYKEPLTLRLAVRNAAIRQSPADKATLRLLLEAGSDPNLPWARGSGETIYQAAKRFYGDSARVLKEFGGED